jgi:hypothetical protein
MNNLPAGIVYCTTLWHWQDAVPCGQALSGLPGLRTAIRTRSLCVHFEERCPRIQGPLWYRVRKGSQCQRIERLTTTEGC